MTVLLWLRRDLRLTDHPALCAAAQSGPVLPVYIRDGDEEETGAAALWMLDGALRDMSAQLERLGAPLVLRTGPAPEILSALAHEIGADSVFCSHRFDPRGRVVEESCRKKLTAQGLAFRAFQSSLLFAPDEILTQNGAVYKVFTPFAKTCRARIAETAPLPPPCKIQGIGGIASETLDSWNLKPTRPDWASGIAAAWPIGEAAAKERLSFFLDNGLSAYHQKRDRPDQDGTSRLSPYLAVGQIGVRQIWHAVRLAMAADPANSAGGEVYLNELLWREFSYHLLYHCPSLPDQPLQPAYARFPWRRDPAGLRAWQRGLTGYPIVDAGMRQLWAEGWMHNRVRMIVGSFLVKDLLLPWHAGLAWFADTLVDADPASNAASWQWIGGCGADAAPYFRVFNPVLQGQKFDPEGAYVRHYVPELAAIKGAAIHAPWLLPPAQRPDSYPPPIVDHARARLRALEALAKIRDSGH